MDNPFPGIIDLTKAGVQKLNHPLMADFGIHAEILRLDLIHPVISGNKWFKLKYHLSEAIVHQKQGICTFGGVWSNHLIATAMACRLAGLKSIGIIRGERPLKSNPVIDDLEDYRMKLFFLERKKYAEKDISSLDGEIQNYQLVPEGGCSSLGIKGAAEIIDLINESYDYVFCAIGTGTTMAGLLKNSRPRQKVIGISSLKLQPGNNIEDYIRKEGGTQNFEILYDYHFGGYAKSREELTNFMKQLYKLTGIATDRVYTAKLFYGFLQEVKKGRFRASDRICLIHSGGLSGNRSLNTENLGF